LGPNVWGGGGSQVIKYEISDNAYEHLEFPTVGENIGSNITAIILLQAGRIEGGEGRCVDQLLKCLE